MQAIPYRSWLSTTTTTGGGSNGGESTTTTSLPKLISENAVIVFGRRGCCMCHVVKLLLLGLGVNPTISAIDEKDEASIVDQLSKIGNDSNDDRIINFPAVFVGGKLFGGLERVMATHISGELVPILKDAGALWL